MNWRTAAKITCPCCFGTGQIDRQAPVPLAPQQFRIFDIVRRSEYGIAGSALANRLYADRQDGGPISGQRCVQSQVMQINKRLAKVNLRIGSKTRNGPYFLLQTKSSGAEHAA